MAVLSWWSDLSGYSDNERDFGLLISLPILCARAGLDFSLPPRGVVESWAGGYGVVLTS